MHRPRRARGLALGVAGLTGFVLALFAATLGVTTVTGSLPWVFAALLPGLAAANPLAAATLVLVLISFSAIGLGWGVMAAIFFARRRTV